MRRIAMGLVLGATAFAVPARADDAPADKKPVQVQRSQGGGAVRAMTKAEFKMHKAPAAKAGEGKVPYKTQESKPQ